MIAMLTKCESISLSLCFSFYPAQISLEKKQRGEKKLPETWRWLEVDLLTYQNTFNTISEAWTDA